MTQTEYIFKKLSQGYKIDTRLAASWGITRLSARILELKNKGVHINRRMKQVPTRWNNLFTHVAEYWVGK